ncbi:DUF411 domain-containing protein [Vibrio agarivorans]|uniref:DUF411 domain-containing protein n=1 Tax=Vibrio agarivorans TaxID=153622 RepID=A0ABT7XXM5_9VIBR|nr:DUF411 domain-containing protein [Vibrio agarivorans]MDN2480534.1 DUF411 domain-containing protein [Vibrio agarivorans]
MTMTKLALASMALFSASALANTVINHKSPHCGCCGGWSEHMEENGFNVEEKLHDNMLGIKQSLGITQELASCHTAEIDGYVFEGHIPAQDIEAFLANPPAGAKGLAVPGMPLGSPGMEYGDTKHEYVVYVFNEKGQVAEFNRYEGNQ